MWSITNSAGHFRLATSLRKGHANLAKLSFGRAYTGISCETLEASQFPQTRDRRCNTKPLLRQCLRI
jgi:hypothetical protein